MGGGAGWTEGEDGGAGGDGLGGGELCGGFVGAGEAGGEERTGEQYQGQASCETRDNGEVIHAFLTWLEVGG